MSRIIEVTRTLVINEKTREWCRLPYPNHPYGCPNWNRKEECPPKVGIVSDIFDLLKKHWFAVVEFDLAWHCHVMLTRHPNWSVKQAICCLYWQNGVRKELKALCSDFQNEYHGLIYTLLPEAMGVNVFATAYRYGINLQRNPTMIVYKIALIGYPKIKNILLKRIKK